MTQQPDWKNFEKLIALIHKLTAPNATVKHNQKKMGLSGRQRQLDVTMSQKIGLHEVFIVIECKHQKRRVGIATIDAFVTKLRDVQASLGVIVSSGTFDNGARAQAERNNITLLSYREAELFDWNNLVSENTWIKLTELVHQSIRVALPPLPLNFPVESDTLFSQGNKTYTLHDILDLFMTVEADKHYRRSTDFSVEFRTTDPLFVHMNRSLIQISCVQLFGKLTAKQYLIRPQFGGGSILKNEITKQQTLSRVYTEDIAWGNILESQRYIELTPEEYRKEPHGSYMTLDPEILKQHIRFEFIRKEE